MSTQTSQDSGSNVPKRTGRPGVPAETLAKCRLLLLQGATVEQVKEATNLGLTKIYEVRRQLCS